MFGDCRGIVCKSKRLNWPYTSSEGRHGVGNSGVLFAEEAYEINVMNSGRIGGEFRHENKINRDLVLNSQPTTNDNSIDSLNKHLHLGEIILALCAGTKFYPFPAEKVGP